MSFRFLMWSAFVVLLASGASGWFFFGERTPSAQTAARADYAARLETLRLAAETGNFEAWAAYGTALAQGPKDLQDPAAALVWLRKAADKGYPPAQVEIGKLYWSGHGVARDYHRAQEWFNLAARLSKSPDAHFMVGEGYFRGLGVPQDYGTAIGFYKTAARQGHPVAQYLIGAMYEAGWGVDADLIEAWVWFKRAEPGAAVIRAHAADYDVITALQRVDKKMNNSQRGVAEKRLAAGMQ